MRKEAYIEMRETFEHELQHIARAYREEIAALASDNETCFQITFGATLREDSFDWGWQSGDNSFSGAAYFHPHWAVVYLTPDSNLAEVAEDACQQIQEEAEDW